jgi:anti-sigma factor RsiW
VTCDPEKVTGYVDAALAEPERLALEAHLARCAACRDQAASERSLRAELRTLPDPEPRAGFEQELGSRLRRRRARPPVWLPLAAALAAVAFWGLGSAPVVAWQLARDHDHCFGMPALPAELWTSQAEVARSWFAARGTSLPPLPDSSRGLLLVGGRHCPLLDRSVAHLYYSEGDRRVSLFVVPGRVRFEDHYETTARGRAVRLLRVSGATVALVGGSAADVNTIAEAFLTTRADLGAAPGV